MFIILPAELVDDALEVVFSSIGIIGLYSRLVVLVDQILVIFGRALLDLRFRATTFNAVIQACEIRRRGLRKSQIDSGVVSCDHGEGRIVRSWGGVVQSRMSSCEVLSREVGKWGWGCGEGGYVYKHERWAVP